MRSIWKAVLWLSVFTTVSAVCAVIVITALRSPVSGALSRYTATFSDVSGLFVGDDVRISGVQVGKVDSIALDGRTARVDFTVLADHAVYRDTNAAVRYQNLLGQRYVELLQPAAPGLRLPPGAEIPLGRTIPSFDVTRLFNGFRPIFATLDPAQFNQFGQNLLRIIQGDETGIGPFLHDLDELSTLAVDRQAVICHEDGTTGWPATMDHLFGSVGMIGGRRAGVNCGLLAASVGLALDDEFVCC